MLLFRDWLRTHEEDRRRYEALKHELSARTWKHLQNYADAKSDIVAEILGRAQGIPAQTLRRAIEKESCMIHACLLPSRFGAR
jgi:hypothetical protein